ncbi:transcriptional regulator [Bhargavaea ginsengi]|uniref:transcriptional regulator n=1 Tax=Bhargavaea ginsengi TaxID=426757 RepID=UPI003C75E468
MTATMSRLKVSSAAFRHVEAELYAYPDTVKEIKARRAELLSGGSEELVGGKSNLPGDPTGRVAARIIDDKRLRELERIASAIETVMEKLDDDYKDLVRVKYWQTHRALDWHSIAAELNVSRATAHRRRKLIVEAIAEQLGW